MFNCPSVDLTVAKRKVKFLTNHCHNRNGGAENAGVENAGAYRRGGKCRSDKVWKAIRNNTLKHQTKYGCRGFLA